MWAPTTSSHRLLLGPHNELLQAPCGPTSTSFHRLLLGPHNELPQAPHGPIQRAPSGSLWAPTTSSPRLVVGPQQRASPGSLWAPQRAPPGSFWAPTTSSPRLLVGPHNEFPQAPCESPPRSQEKKPFRARRFTGRLRGAPRPARSPRMLFAGAELKGFGGSPASALQHGFLHMLSCISFQTFKIGLGRK